MKNIFKDSIPGAILGLWSVLQLWLVWVLVSSSISLQYGKDVTIKKSLYWGLSYILKNYSFEASELTLGIIIGGMALSAIWFFIDRKYQTDPYLISANSIKWSLRVISKPVTVLSFLTPLAVTAYAYIISNDWLLLASTLISFLAILILPFSVLRDSVLRSESGDNWWVPEWPGLWPVVSLVLIVLSSILFDIIIFIFNSIISEWLNHLDILTSTFYILIPELFPPVMAAVFIHKLSPGAAINKAKRVFAWRIIGPILALHVKLNYYLMFIVVPLVSLNILFVYVVPAYSRWITDHGYYFPKYIKYGVSCMEFAQRTGWSTFTIPIVVSALLFSGRLVWLLSNQNCGEQLPNSSVDSDERA